MRGHSGSRILLTRSRDDCAAWKASLDEQGISAVVLPCISTELIDTPQTREALSSVVARADWLVFTSKRGVSAFTELLDTAVPTATRIAAVGEATGEAAASALGRIDVVGTGGTAAALADQLAAEAGPGVYVLAIAENASSVLEDRLAEAGREPIRVNVYRTIPAPSAVERRAYSSLGSDAVFLASPSAAEGFVNQVELDVEADIFTIGPSTTAAAERLGLKVSAQAPRPSLAGLLEAMQCPK